MSVSTRPRFSASRKPRQQRLTSLFLLPLTLWFAYSLSRLPALSHAAFIDWLQTPWNWPLLLIYLSLSVWHAKLGIRVIVDDYLHHPLARQMLLKITQLILSTVWIITLGATLKIVFTGP